LGTLSDFGGNDTLGMVLGGTLNGAYTVNLGTSGLTHVTLQGTGHHDITGATGVVETYVMGSTSTGASTLRNLDINDLVDVGAAMKGTLDTLKATASTVTAKGQYALVGSTLTWWNDTSGHNHADTLTLQFAGVTNHMQLQADGHTFKVV
jgi:hypothetical protein